MNRLFIRRVSVDSAAIPPGSYLAGLPAVHGGGLVFTSPVTFFIGENGTGKSTLIEAIAVAYGLNPEGGSRNFAFSTRDSHSPLWRAVRLEKGPIPPHDAYFLRAESFYNVATNIDELDDAPGGPLAADPVCLRRRVTARTVARRKLPGARARTFFRRWAVHP